MKYLIFSDIHGSIESAKFIVEQFANMTCDKMICLGDVLYHGPRNDLPDYYRPKEVVQLLNSYSEHILCIKGNCDAEVDEMVLNFPLVNAKDVLLNGIQCHLEHGHHLDKEKDYAAQVIFYGHTHIASIEKYEQKIFINPGSITLPKENTKRSFLILDEDKITLYDMSLKVIKELQLN